MTEKKTKISKAEYLLQIEELNRTILPELLLERAKSLNITCPSDDQNYFLQALNSPDSGMRLLTLIKTRIKKLIETGKWSPNDSSSTIISAINEEMHILEHYLKQINIISNPLSDNPSFTENTLSSIIFSSFLVGYHTSNHDYNVNIGRHAENGFKHTIQDTQKGGQAKANKQLPLKNLIIEMASSIYGSIDLGRVNKVYISEAIFQVLYEFNKKNMHLDCFNAFTDSEIKQRFVEKQFKHHNKTGATHNESTRTLIAKLKKTYTNTLIGKKLKNK